MVKTSDVQETKYLKLGHKLAYGSGDLATNFCWGFLNSFLLIYLTDTVGLNPGIVGTLMLIARVLDGISDIIAGNMIDRTNTKMGKARPYFVFTILPLVVCEIMLFSIPAVGEVAQYAYFFVIYSLLNVVFFTFNNIAYATMTALITNNKQERVQLGVFRFVFATSGTLVIASFTNTLIQSFGGGVGGWRKTAILYACIFAFFELLCGIFVKELPQNNQKVETAEKKEKGTLLRNLRYLVGNKYFVHQLIINIVYNALNTITTGVGIYFMTYRFNNPELLGVFSMTMVIPLMVGLVLSPVFVKKFGIYKTNLVGFAITTVMCIPFLIFGLTGNVTGMLICSVIRWIGSGPVVGNGGALTAEIAEYSARKDGVNIAGSVYSCSSMGGKVGTGLASALTGWLLAASGYDGMLAVQPASAINMITILYAVVPLIISSLMLICLYLQKVEQANKELEQAQKKAASSD